MIGLVDGNNFFVSCERVVDPRLNGRPVAVLSNNDGCCVSRSNEFKALGIPMGTPYFQLKDRERTGELVFRSSNYELYGDMSRRVISILRDLSVDVEQYSIDEAFIHPPSTVTDDLAAYGKRVRARVLQWTGIPCGVGFAPTKTLAKIANHIGKKRPDGVFVMPDDPTPVLKELPVGEVWGIGRQMVQRLKAERVFTALQFRDLPDDMLRAIREEVGALFIPGARYRKSGVVFFGLERAGAPRQGDLFAVAEPTRPSKLYKAVDALNARYGRGMVFSAAEGIAKPWKMKRGKLSPRATTNWNELLVVG